MGRLNSVALRRMGRLQTEIVRNRIDPQRFGIADRRGLSIQQQKSNIKTLYFHKEVLGVPRRAVNLSPLTRFHSNCSRIQSCHRSFDLAALRSAPIVELSRLNAL
ncbi:hypothetical protein Poly24_44130 [Rosistilla carotiformis]|uniref:Uncharacterized protein n=1 Tax=Rosistilla carotiformis TaxID=2528017 RepID=A0A518JYS2_9BACT|nr:hypothetical protein Poly24_44130 [Rosistilla carotiformis]